jgi:DNA repair photolyase
VLPYLSDSPAQLEQTVRQIAAAGAASVTQIVLHLRPGAREWFLAWLADRRPDLAGAYRQLYGAAAYAPAAYQRQIGAIVAELAAKYGVGGASPANARRIRSRARPGAPPPAASQAAAAGTQLSLL